MSSTKFSMRDVYKKILDVNFSLSSLYNTMDELVDGNSLMAAEELLTDIEYLDESVGALKERIIALMEEIVGEKGNTGEQTDNGIKL